MPPTPQNPNPDFDFMLKQNGAPARASLVPHLPKWLAIGLAVLAGIIILIIISSVISGSKSGAAQPFINATARAEETLRVTKVAQQLNFQDPQTEALAATINTTLTSDTKQLITYMSKNHYKFSTALLAADTNKTTDTSFQSASQNNSLDTTYITYLRDALARYQNDLSVAYKQAGPNGKQLLKGAYDGTQVLLSTPPLKT